MANISLSAIGSISEMPSSSADKAISPGVLAVMGIVPVKGDEDERAVYREYLAKKYEDCRGNGDCDIIRADGKEK